MEEIEITDLPKLQGSDKQVKWANDIRSMRVGRYNHAINCDANERKNSSYLSDIDNLRFFMRPFIQKNEDPLYKGIDESRIIRMFKMLTLPKFSSKLPYEESLKEACEKAKYQIAYRDRYENQLNGIIDRFYSIAITDWTNLKENSDEEKYRKLIFAYARKNILDVTSASFWINGR